MFIGFTHTMLGIIMVLAIVSAVLFLPAVRRFAIRNILVLVQVTYLLGFILYLWGFWFGASGNFFTTSLRAAISALEMFASQSDLVEVNEVLKEENVFYMMAFSAVHFAAFSLTLIFILDMFGKRLVSRLYSKFLLMRCRNRKIFIFDSADEKAALIAGSLPQDRQRLIFFIKSSSEEKVKHFSIYDSVIKGLSTRSESDVCEPLGNILWSATSLQGAIDSKRGWLYRRVVNILCRCGSAEVFLTSMDSPVNADAAYSLDQVLPEQADVTIYAGVNISKPHAQKLLGKPRIKIYNRSRHVVDDLFSRTPLLREGFGRRTLILGFGYTARYCIQELVKAGFTRMDIIDPEVGKRREEFLCFNPELRDMEGLRFFSCSLKSNEYWSYLNDMLSDIDNVIVFGQDDETNYENAAMIAGFAGKIRNDLSDFRIYLMEKEAQPGDDAPCFHSFGRNCDICNYRHIQ